MNEKDSKDENLKEPCVPPNAEGCGPTELPDVLSADELNKDKEDETASPVELLRKLWSLLRPEVTDECLPLIAAALMMLLVTCLGLLGPFLLHRILDNAASGGDMRAFRLDVFLLALSLFLCYLLWGVKIRIATYACERVFYKLKDRLLRTLMRKQISFFNSISEGDLITRMVSDVTLLSTFFYEYVIRSIVSIIICIGIAIFLVAWHPLLGLVSLLAIPIYLLVTNLVLGPVERRSQTVREKLTEQNENLLGILGGLREIRFFQQEKLSRSLFDRISSEYTQAAARSTFARDWALNAIQGMGMLVSFTPVVFGSWLIINGNTALTVGVLIAYFAYLTDLTISLVGISDSMMKLAEASPARRRIQEVLDYPEDESFTREVNVGSVRSLELEHVPDKLDIVFESVSFGYGDKKILHDVTLQIAEGEKVAIVGPSGCGKSTLLTLLLRFQSPSSGRILLGGRNIDDYPLPFYLSMFSQVSQSPVFFKFSIAENIRFGWYNVPQDLIEKAAEMVRLDEYIRSLPDGYDTLFGVGGMDMSGGQKQRLSLARALIRDPAILVLDEFTSALDQHVSEEIVGDMLEAFANQTIICITHSHNIVKRFDRVIDMGEINNLGTFI